MAKRKRKRAPAFPAPESVKAITNSHAKALIRVPKETSKSKVLRGLACLAYATDPSLPSLEDVAQNPNFKGVSLTTLKYWSAADHWVDKRAEYQDQIYARAKAAVGRRQVAHYVEMCDDLHALFVDSYKKLMGKDEEFEVPPARSYEGLVRAVAFLASKYADLARGVIDATTPDVAALSTAATSAQEQTPVMAAKLTPEEQHAAIAVVLKMRAAEVQGDDDDEESQEFDEDTGEGEDVDDDDGEPGPEETEG